MLEMLHGCGHGDELRMLEAWLAKLVEGGTGFGAWPGLPGVPVITRACSWSDNPGFTVQPQELHGTGLG